MNIIINEIKEKDKGLVIDILNYLPDKISNLISNYNLEELEEIRIRVNRPVILKFTSKEIVINYNVKQEEILKILQFICDNSIYTYQNQICNRIYNN